MATLLALACAGLLTFRFLFQAENDLASWSTHTSYESKAHYSAASAKSLHLTSAHASTTAPSMLVWDTGKEGRALQRSAVNASVHPKGQPPPLPVERVGMVPLVASIDSRMVTAARQLQREHQRRPDSFPQAVLKTPGCAFSVFLAAWPIHHIDVDRVNIARDTDVRICAPLRGGAKAWCDGLPGCHEARGEVCLSALSSSAHVSMIHAEFQRTQRDPAKGFDTYPVVVHATLPSHPRTTCSALSQLASTSTTDLWIRSDLIIPWSCFDKCTDASWKDMAPFIFKTRIPWNAVISPQAPSHARRDAIEEAAACAGLGKGPCPLTSTPSKPSLLIANGPVWSAQGSPEGGIHASLPADLFLQAWQAPGSTRLIGVLSSQLEASRRKLGSLLVQPLTELQDSLFSHATRPAFCSDTEHDACMLPLPHACSVAAGTPCNTLDDVLRLAGVRVILTPWLDKGTRLEHMLIQGQYAWGQWASIALYSLFDLGAYFDADGLMMLPGGQEGELLEHLKAALWPPRAQARTVCAVRLPLANVRANAKDVQSSSPGMASSCALSAFWNSARNMRYCVGASQGNVITRTDSLDQSFVHYVQHQSFPLPGPPLPERSGVTPFRLQCAVTDVAFSLQGPVQTHIQTKWASQNCTCPGLALSAAMAF